MYHCRRGTYFLRPFFIFPFTEEGEPWVSVIYLYCSTFFVLLPIGIDRRIVSFLPVVSWSVVISDSLVSFLPLSALCMIVFQIAYIASLLQSTRVINFRPARPEQQRTRCRLALLFLRYLLFLRSWAVHCHSTFIPACTCDLLHWFHNFSFSKKSSLRALT